MYFEALILKITKQNPLVPETTNINNVIFCFLFKDGFCDKNVLI